jgi:dGTPase
MNNPLDNKIYEERTISKEYPIRGEFFRDQTAIIHSMPFRRLKHKTQVFFSPENDHVCTRIEHVMHVATIAASICKGLNKNGWSLNEEMAFAIGLGHDVGHAPFGHAGENALNKKLNGDFKFVHEVNSYRVVEYLANEGKGLNLTYGVKDGIINHNGEKILQYIIPNNEKNNLDEIKDRNKIACSYEGVIVRFSDVIAYLGRDIEDAILAKLISIKDVPNKIKKELGNTNGEIINTLIENLIENSKDKNKIGFSNEKFEMIERLRKFNYEKIYNHDTIVSYRTKGEEIIGELFDFFLELYNENGQDYQKYESSRMEACEKFGRYLSKMKDFYDKEKNIPKRIVCDYIAGMTDNYTLEVYRSVKLPTPIKFT